jgi:hypothetical protein
VSTSFTASERPGQWLAQIARPRALIIANAGSFAALTIGYFVAATAVAAHHPFAMDEVLAVWTARLPTLGAIWDALNKGAEFSPPLYHVILKYFVQLGGSGTVILRLPSIIAVYFVSIAAFTLVRRRHSTSVAMIAMAVCLTSCLFFYAVQARQYASVTACFSAALMLWDIRADKPPSWRRAAALFGLLAIAVGMHFYAVLLAAGVGLMELMWTTAHRRVRWPYMVAIGLACMSIALWLPIMQHAAAFNSGDTGATEYYAIPQFRLLPAIYAYLLLDFESNLLSPLTLLVAAAVIYLLLRPRDNASNIRQAPLGNLDIIIWVSCALPLLIFMFSYLVTHTFNVRYVIAATLGFSVLTARLIAPTRWATAWSYLIVAAAVGSSLHAITTTSKQTTAMRALALVNRAPPDLRIGTGDGLRFLELRESAMPTVGRRMVYLKSPAGTFSPDPTNEHQVERWAAIDPNLSVTDIAPFVATHSRFLLFSDGESVDLLPQQLVAQGHVVNMLLRDGNAYIAEVMTTGADAR